MKTLTLITVAVLCCPTVPGQELAQPRPDKPPAYTLAVWFDVPDWRTQDPQLVLQIAPEQVFSEIRSEQIECPTDLCVSNVGCFVNRGAAGLLHLDGGGNYQLTYGIYEVHPCGIAMSLSTETPSLPLGTTYTTGVIDGMCRDYTVLVTRGEANAASAPGRQSHSGAAPN